MSSYEYTVISNNTILCFKKSINLDFQKILIVYNLDTEKNKYIFTMLNHRAIINTISITNTTK